MKNIIKSSLKHSTHTVDYYQLSPKQKTKLISRTQNNLDFVKRLNSDISYTFDEERLWKSVLPRRSGQSTLGPGQNNPHQFVSELAQTKSYGDLSGKQISALNHINEVLECEELKDKLPEDIQIVVDSSDDYQIEYKMNGSNKKAFKNVKHATSSNIFSQHFTFTGGR